jgi:hypothetical protein
MLTRDILFGVNILTLLGLLMTGSVSPCIPLARASLPLHIGVIGIRMAEVQAGLQAGGWPR